MIFPASSFRDKDNNVQSRKYAAWGLYSFPIATKRFYLYQKRRRETKEEFRLFLCFPEKVGNKLA